MNTIEKHLYEKGRKDGLEEAAKAAELYDFVGPDHLVEEGRRTLKRLIADIRALKDKS